MEGDENLNFFHGYINSKNKKNRINGLTINGKWSSDASKVKLEALHFFKNKFTETRASRPKLLSPYFKSLSVMHAIKLEAPFSHKELKYVIWACGSEKAPGPDGLTFKFLKTSWEIIKGDMMNFVLHFDKFGTFARGCNSSFISLVPNVKDPTDLTNY